MKWSRPLLLVALPLALGWGCFLDTEDGSLPEGVAGASGASGASSLACEDSGVELAECSAAELTQTCNSGARCCECVSLPPCGDVWACVETGTGTPDEGCPAGPPASGAACDTEALSCRYCTADGPSVMSCSVVRGTDPVEFAWNPGPLGVCTE